MFQDQSDALLFGVGQYGLPHFDTSSRSRFIVHAIETHAGKCDDVLGADRCRQIDAICQFLDDHVFEFGITRPLGKPMAA